MLYPFFDPKCTEEVDDESPEEYTRILEGVNRETLTLAGAYILKFNVIDRDPKTVIQEAMDQLTALVYERDHAAVKGESTRIEMEFRGKGRRDELAAFAEGLTPEQKAAMALIIRQTGAEKASIYEILDRLGTKVSNPLED